MNCQQSCAANSALGVLTLLISDRILKFGRTHSRPAWSPRVTGLWITLFHQSRTLKGFRRRKASSIHRSLTLFWMGVPTGAQGQVLRHSYKDDLGLDRDLKTWRKRGWLNQSLNVLTYRTKSSGAELSVPGLLYSSAH